MRRSLALFALLVALLAAFALVGCGDDDRAPEADGTPASRHVTFMAGFRAQANLPFVAVYVAQAKGYFADEGLEVDIRHSSGQDEHLKLLLAKEVDFTTGTAAQLLARRADGLPIRAVALFGQRGDQGFVVRADSGIQRPADFAGKTVGFKAGVVPAELKALLASGGLSEKDVKLQGVGFDPRVFIEGGLDVYPVFLSNEPYAIRKAGVDVRVFDPADYGVATLGLTFLAHEDTVRGDPDLVRRFLRASMRGVEYAAAHVDEAVDITLRYANGADPGQQRYLLETDLANARRADGIGRSSPEQWDALQATLLKFGALDHATDARAAIDTSIIDGLYGADGRLRPR
ncbi:MAG TPA: ABC transporter substrate-binding protein [Dehalococcoidia bacterium]|nr:ABC transporter substrate-binding protein [Dehalococcoidia bacterium]